MFAIHAVMLAAPLELAFPALRIMNKKVRAIIGRLTCICLLSVQCAGLAGDSAEINYRDNGEARM